MKNRISVLTLTIIVRALTAVQGLAQSTYEPYTFTTLAGSAGYGSVDGTGRAAQFSRPSGVAVDSAGNVYVADYWNNTIRKVTPTGVVTTLAGLPGTSGSTDGTGTDARFAGPSGVAVDSAGNVYVGDGSTIRKVTPAGVVTTLAGLASSAGSADGTGSDARFFAPSGVAVDSAGTVYVADEGNNTVRKVTPAGVVTTLAGLAGSVGSANGTGNAARFNHPTGVAVDNAGNVFLAESGNHTIRKVTPTGTVTTLAGVAGNQGNVDGTDRAARFNNPRGVAVDISGNVYVADYENHTIRKVTPAGVTTTLAGRTGSPGGADGTGSTARFNFPFGLAVDNAGNVYVADSFNNTIRTVTPTGVVTTLAGLAAGSGSADGMGSDARFNQPSGVALDSVENVYVADYENHTIRKVTPAGVVTTLAGLPGRPGSADGAGSAARFRHPQGVAVDSAGNVFVADSGNHTIRKVTSAGVVTTLAGLAGSTGSADGTGTSARFSGPFGVAVDSAGDVYVADSFNATIRKVTPAGVTTTLAGQAGSQGSANGIGSAARFNGPQGVAVDSAGNVYVADSFNATIRKVTPTGVVTTLAELSGPSGLAVDSAGNVYVADTDDNTIRKVKRAGEMTTLAGPGGIGSADGMGRDVQFFSPSGLAVDSAGNVYVADKYNHTIRKGYPARRIPYETYTFTTLAGNAGYGSEDGTGSDAQFWQPQGVALDSAGNVYVADSKNHTIRKVTPVGLVTTLAGLAGIPDSADGTGSAARFNQPSGVAVDSAGNVYVADSFNNTIRKVTPEGVVTTLAGLAGSNGSADGTGSAAQFDYPSGVAVDSAGNVYVADSSNNTIRKVTPAGLVTTLAGLTQLDAAGNHLGGNADGTGSDARFYTPTGVAVDSAGNVYVADLNNKTIRKVTPAGVATTLASGFNSPQGVAVDSAGNVYVADTFNYTIRKVTPAGVVATLAGLTGGRGSADGMGSDARFGSVDYGGPTGLAVDSAGNVYAADPGNNTIRKVTPTGVVTTLAGLAAVSSGSADGTGSDAQFNYPRGVAVDSTGNVYVADTGNNTIRKVTPTGVVTTLAGFAPDESGNPNSGSADGTGSDARFNVPSGLAMDSAGKVYVADTYNNMIRKMTPAGDVTTLAGLAQLDANGNPLGGSADGTGSAARFNHPLGVAVDSEGNVYVADSNNNTIRKVTPAGVVTTLAGLAGEYGSADGTAGASRFNGPSGVAVDSASNVYVADTWNHTIRKVTAAGIVTTLAGLAPDESGNPNSGSADGTGSAAQFSRPSGVAVDSAGNVYVAEKYNVTIRKVTPAGVVTTLAGLPGKPGGADGTGSDARFGKSGNDAGFVPLSGPAGVAVDSAGNVYVADTVNNTIRKGFAAPRILNSGPDFGFNGGQFGFGFTGPAGKSVVMEASTDLVSWLPLWTNTFAFPAALKFSDPQSGASSTRFYRARLP